MLTQFYKDMQAWVDAGCPPHSALTKTQGLCDNLVRWCNQQKSELTLYTQMRNQMRNQFKEAGKNIYFPFNFDENTSYPVEAEAGLCYTNKQRLDWIKQHANPVL